MHDGAAGLAEHGVVLVLAGKGEAVVAALARAMVARGPEIPAARPLQQVAAECCHVADLRACRIFGSVSQGCIALANDWATGDLRDCDQGAYTHRAVLFLDDPVEPGNTAKVDDPAWLKQALLHQVEKVDPTGLDHYGILGRLPTYGCDHGGGNGCRA